MTLTEFCALCNREKMDLLHQQGLYIGKRWLNGRPILLYQLEGFYIEICYRRYRTLVGSVHCFADTQRLDPYLTNIAVEHLVV